MLSGLKAKALEAALNSRISRYGRLEIANLDTSTGKISGRLHLEGEPTPIAFSAGYCFLAGTGGKQLQISSFRSDRPWLDRLAQDHLLSRPLPLAGAWVSLAEKLL